ncbi:uncharacterized protein BDZ83DRAFT_317561 [Colletotrichum acutatum]|uniref:Uncharacterized protein n=1 Tax=Glomerella acutata TaxID=27357 RepID=A0AAD8UPY2_GLOAC|nr:uncharacterized protein BDZ83DRAFT_317561 [Colletotrichum acutatum]KAK1725064.1 hypothetical protein BDZ83DRAFT_317561 [Colletotrichum acutatum]
MPMPELVFKRDLPTFVGAALRSRLDSPCLPQPHVTQTTSCPSSTRRCRAVRCWQAGSSPHAYRLARFRASSRFTRSGLATLVVLGLIVNHNMGSSLLSYLYSIPTLTFHQWMIFQWIFISSFTVSGIPIRLQGRPAPVRKHHSDD